MAQKSKSAAQSPSTKVPLITDEERVVLAREVEKLGGRFVDNFLDICKSNEAFFGESGSLKRRSFQKGRYNLQRLVISTYWKLLLDAGIEPHENTRGEYDSFLLLQHRRKTMSDADELSKFKDTEADTEATTVDDSINDDTVADTAPKVPSVRFSRMQPPPGRA